MEKDKQHLVNIEKVEINNIYTNHVDTSDILSQLQILKMQNKKILEILLSTEDDEREREQIMRKLNKVIADLKKTV